MPNMSDIVDVRRMNMLDDITDQQIANDLSDALRKLDGGNAWQQGALATDAEGRNCYPESDRACKFCARGAIEAVACANDRHHPDTRSWDRATAAARAISDHIVHYATHGDAIQRIIEDWNDDDSTTWDQVEEMFQAVIHSLRS